MYKYASMPFHTLASVLVWYIAWDDLGAISAIAKLQSIEVMQLVLTWALECTCVSIALSSERVSNWLY